MGELLNNPGGGLELSKYLYDTLHWQLNKDVRVKISERFDGIELWIQKSTTCKDHNIRKLNKKYKVKYLEVTSSRDGN